MSFDHKPSLPFEEKRIIKAGGFVEKGRVNGRLTVSRSIGDLKFKCNPNLTLEEQMVVAVPEIYTYTPSPQFDFLFIA